MGRRMKEDDRGKRADVLYMGWDVGSQIIHPLGEQLIEWENIVRSQNSGGQGDVGCHISIESGRTTHPSPDCRARAFPGAPRGLGGMGRWAGDSNWHRLHRHLWS